MILWRILLLVWLAGVSVQLALASPGMMTAWGLVGMFACLCSVLVKARFSRLIIAILAIGAITVYEIVEATIRPADASVTHLLFTGFGVVLGYGLALLEGWL